jgi:hypothetical protein
MVNLDFHNKRQLCFQLCTQPIVITNGLQSACGTFLLSGAAPLSADNLGSFVFIKLFSRSLKFLAQIYTLFLLYAPITFAEFLIIQKGSEVC